MVRDFRKDLEQNLKDPEFAKVFGAAQAKSQFALTLAKARRNARMSQKELADKLGRSQPYIAKLESGEANPTLGSIGTILAIMNQRLITDAVPLGFYPSTATLVSGDIQNIDFLRGREGEIQEEEATATTYKSIKSEDEVINGREAHYLHVRRRS